MGWAAIASTFAKLFHLDWSITHITGHTLQEDFREKRGLATFLTKNRKVVTQIGFGNRFRGLIRMDTMQHQNWLQSLEARLQQSLQEFLPDGKALRVRCGLRQGELVVLTQHPSAIAPDTPQLFKILEQALRAAQDAMKLGELPCRLGLRVIGQKQPYATHAMTLEAGPSATDVDSAHTAPPLDSFPELDSSSERDAAQSSGAGAATSSSELLRLAEQPTVETADFGLARSPEEPPEYSPRRRSPDFWASPLTILGTALGAFVLGLGGYMLSRPCVVGGCSLLQTAPQQAEAALQTIQQPESAQQVIDAYDQLVGASYSLSKIPSWSGSYSSAQKLIAFYESEAQILEKVVVGQKRAYEAAVKSQNPPHPLPTWREVQQLWQAAIAQLDQVPTDSPIFTLAQSKKAEYQTNLSTINEYISGEQRAQEYVRLARQTINLANSRGSTANSLASWKQTYDTWQVAINLLRQVSVNTMASGEAQQLLALNEPKWKASGDRLRQEQIASDAYDAALAIASQAQQSQRDRQWTQAVIQWRNALERIQQVPNGTSRFTQAQPLITAYRDAMATAQQKLRLAVGWQSAQGDLELACGNVPRLCIYTTVGDAVQVRLTANYTNAAQGSVVPSANPSDKTAMLAYMNPLLQELAAIGERTNLPIELYNPDGTLFGTYAPQLDGYVPMRAADIARGNVGRQ